MPEGRQNNNGAKTPGPYDSRDARESRDAVARTPTAPLVEIDRLTKRFGALTAVENVSLVVEKGEVLGFLGPNGAGKSTTMKMVAGFVEPTSGTARVCGYDVRHDPVEVKRRLGYLPEGAPVYGDMTPLAYLRFIAEIRGFDGAERNRRVDAVVTTTSLEEVLHQRVETLSKGFKRRVGLAQAMLHDPPVLIMDEPTDGLDPNQKRHVRALIREMAKDKAIVISTHILEEVEAVCSRAVIIARGRIRADGRPDELRARAHDHNVVLLSVRPEAAEAVRMAISGLTEVRGVETVARSDGLVRMRVLPKEPTGFGARISAVVQQKQLPVQDLFVEQGSLDEFFWRITSEEMEQRDA